MALAGKVVVSFRSSHITCHINAFFQTNRAHWKLLSSHETPILDLFGIHAVAGNAELFRQNYRVCNVTKRVASCPPAVTFNQYPFDDEEKLIFSKVLYLYCMKNCYMYV